MKTEHKFAITLKTMMEEKPLDEITVLSICKRCRVNRQTFYYHFHDIYDLLTLVYLDEEITGIDNSSSFKEMVTCIFKYYEKNSKFVDATLLSSHKELLQEFLYNNCYLAIWRIVGDCESSKSISNVDKKNITTFFASAFSNSSMYYLASHKRKTLDGLLKSVLFIDQPDLVKIMQNIAKS